MAKFCGKYGSPLDLQTGRCPACGWTFTPSGAALPPDTPPVDTPSDMPPKKRHTALWIILGVVAAAVVVVGVLVHLGVIDIPQGIKQGQRLSSGSNRVLVREEWRGADGSLWYYDKYVYNAEGQMIREDSYDVTNGVTDEDNMYCVYEYDAEGREISQTWYIYGDVCMSRETSEYSDEGQLTKHSFYNGKDGTCTYYSVYEYDSDGQLVKLANHHGSITQDDYDVYEYNSAGQLVKDSYYMGDGTMIRNIVYEYNDEGQTEKKSYYYSDGTLYAYDTFEYDKDGRKTRETSCGEDSSISYDMVYTYDDYGDLIRLDIYTGDGDLDNYHTYEYAALGEAA